MCQMSLEAEHEAVDKARVKVGKKLRRLKLRPATQAVREEAYQYYRQQLGDEFKRVTPRALCAYLRHRYTTYGVLMLVIQGKPGADELYRDVKLYTCARIIQHYGLNMDPHYAAFGTKTGETSGQIVRRLAAKYGI